MILTKESIKKEVISGNIHIEPLAATNNQISINSIDLTLGQTLFEYDIETTHFKAGESSPQYKEITLVEGEAFTLNPNCVYLAVTREVVGSNEYITHIRAKSSISRMFMDVCSGGGQGDVGYINTWTLALTPKVKTDVWLGMPIAQILFTKAYKRDDANYTQDKGSSYASRNDKPTPSTMMSKFNKVD